MRGCASACVLAVWETFIFKKKAQACSSGLGGSVSSLPVTCLTPMSPQSCLLGRTLTERMLSRMGAEGPRRGSPHPSGWQLQQHGHQHMAQGPGQPGCLPRTLRGLGHPFSLGTEQSRHRTSLRHHGCKTYFSAAVSGCKSTPTGPRAVHGGQPSTQCRVCRWHGVRAQPLCHGSVPFPA